MCSDYLGTFARIPRFAQLYVSGRSLDAITLAVEKPELLDTILEPNYSLECAKLLSSDVLPYGYVAIQDTPYSTWIGKL